MLMQLENEDYIVNVFKNVNPNGGKPITDYIIAVDIAKEICMVIGVAPRCKDERQLVIDIHNH